mgnify:CR=1 FL=1
MRGIAPKAAKDHIFPEQYFKMTRTKKVTCIRRGGIQLP